MLKDGSREEERDYLYQEWGCQEKGDGGGGQESGRGGGTEMHGAPQSGLLGRVGGRAMHENHVQNMAVRMGKACLVSRVRHPAW